MTNSPYTNLPIASWESKTRELIANYPIPSETLVNAVLTSWSLIHGVKIGNEIVVGKNYFPTPQILGDFLHELIPVELARFDNRFRKGVLSTEKDVVCDFDNQFSMEIKTSSQKDIYGNRSYAQKTSRSRKDKSGYYLAVNFQPVHKLHTWAPINQIRFGWLDAEDWQGQKAESGQQASLSSDVLQYKLITLYQDQKKITDRS